MGSTLKRGYGKAYEVNQLPITPYSLPNKFGGNAKEVTPVPIPNTEVKLFKAESTWGAGPWEDK